VTKACNGCCRKINIIITARFTAKLSIPTGATEEQGTAAPDRDRDNHTEEGKNRTIVNVLAIRPAMDVQTVGK